MADQVVTFGETMGRLTSPTVGPLRHATALGLSIAGAESNVAIGLSRLGCSARWIGRVGDDEFGRLIEGTLRSEGVSVALTYDATAPTGLLVKERRTSMSTRVQYYRAHSAGSQLNASDLDLDRVRAARIVHLTGITAAISASARAACFAAVEEARSAGTTVSFDVNMRRALWEEGVASPVLRDLVSRADIVFATRDEAELVASGDNPLDLARGIASLGPREVLIKDGARGAVGLVDGDAVRVEAYRVVEIDPVGAGDAFTAGYLAEWCAGEPGSVRIDTAARCGAFAVAVEGDWEGLPSRGDLALLGLEDVVR